MDVRACAVASAIGEPARARMLYSLMDRRARTGTELAVIAGVSPSTASVHLNRLLKERLVQVTVQGKHRYYALHSHDVARVLEGLSVLAGVPRRPFVPTTPDRLRAARTCYDHLAGTLGVRLHDQVLALGWLDPSYAVTLTGLDALTKLGIDMDALRATRRRFAYPCLDWSERRPHLGGALPAAFLHLALERKWLTQDLDSRALTLTRVGQASWPVKADR